MLHNINVKIGFRAVTVFGVGGDDGRGSVYHVYTIEMILLSNNNSSVPQGSVISPVLFILVISDLLSSTSSSIYSFADDTYLSSFFVI